MSIAPALARATRVEEDRHSYNRILVEPVTPVIGTEISGVDLSGPLDQQTVADIRKHPETGEKLLFLNPGLDRPALR